MPFNESVQQRDRRGRFSGAKGSCPSIILDSPLEEPVLSPAAIRRLGASLSRSGRNRLSDLWVEAQQSEASGGSFFELVLKEAETRPEFQDIPRLYLESLDGRYLAMSEGPEDSAPSFVYHVTATRPPGYVEIDGQEWVSLEDYRWREQ